MEQGRILTGAAAGDERAWAELVGQYGGMLTGVAATMRLQPSDAEDAAQQTWIALRENISTLRDPVRLGAWLGVVMRRRCLAVLAQQRRERPAETIDEWAVPATHDPVGEPENERSIIAWNLLDRLPERERIVLRALYEVSDRSYRDVAAELGMPIGSVGPVRIRALRRLERLLAEAPAR